MATLAMMLSHVHELPNTCTSASTQRYMVVQIKYCSSGQTASFSRGRLVAELFYILQ